MAKDEQDTPGIPEPYQAEVKSHRLSERMTRVDAVDDPEFIDPAHASQSVAFHHLPDGRVVRSAGRMVIGARAPMPDPVSLNGMSGAFEQSQLFSSNKDGRQRSISGGAAVALACAVAVGSTAVLTSALNTTIEQDSGGRNPSGRVEGGQVSSRAVMAQSAAIPQATQVASISPVALPQSIAGVERGIIRVAKQDAPGLVVEDISGRPGSEIPLRIEVAQSDTEEYSFLMFRGLPAEISLSAGFRLKDSWAVSLRDLTNLALVSPPNYEARFQVEVLLIKGRNTPADSRVMSVSLQRAPAAAPPPPVAAAPRQEPAPQRILTAAPPEPQLQPQAVAKIEAAAPSLAQPKKMAISQETEIAMLDRATQMLSMGDVSSARLLFEHVAKKGSGKAAMALARTFDPAFFASIGARGLKPDPEKAKQWYAVAADLGQDEARSRLSVLSAR
jgi:hypothetical protein